MTPCGFNALTLAFVTCACRLIVIIAHGVRLQESSPVELSGQPCQRAGQPSASSLLNKFKNEPRAVKSKDEDSRVEEQMSYIKQSFIGMCALALVWAFSENVSAQEARDARPSIRTSAEATVKVAPDQAQIDIGVITQAQNAQAAAQQNAQKLDTVIAALRRALDQTAEIKTVGYSLSPNYRYPTTGGQPTITGYTASNVVQVKTTDLKQIGNLIDIAAQTGSNTIQGLRFMLKDEQAAYADALRQAALKARAKADALASALGLKVQRVLHVEESGASPQPIVYARAAGAEYGKASTPIESGTIDVQAIVTLTVEIAQ
jgi:uncharacterized protein YggE